MKQIIAAILFFAMCSVSIVFSSWHAFFYAVILSVVFVLLYAEKFYSNYLIRKSNEINNIQSQTQEMKKQLSELREQVSMINIKLNMSLK